nr:response regulator transcription factor [Conexibacter sp. SYSU D00693]
MSAAPPQVLVVDDDAGIRAVLERGLGLEGFAVAAVADGTSALEAFAEGAPDAVVLDVGLPDINGRAVCARLRARGIATPILVLSARDQVDDRIAGLEAGADDYLVKPFVLEELAARLRALLRRGTGAAPATPAPEVVRAGELVVDLAAHVATWEGADLGLTRRELELLEALARNAGIVLERRRLLELVWGYDFETDTNVVDVFVSYVRRKLDRIGAPALIHTVRGVGFVLRVP